MSNKRLIAGEEVSANIIKGYLIKDLSTDLTDTEITGVAVSGQVGFELNREREVREIAHKDMPENSTKQSAGKSTWSFSMDGMYIVDDEGYAAIEEAMASADGKIGIYIEVGATRYAGFTILTTNNLSAPYDDQLTYQISGQGTGLLHKLDKTQTVNIKNVAK